MAKNWTFWSGAACAIGSLLLSPGAALAAKPAETVYYTVDHGTSNTYLVGWTSATRAQVTSNLATRPGGLVTTGLQRAITLDQAFTEEFTNAPDSCGNPYTVRRSVEQLVFRQIAGTPRAGQSQVVEIGRETTLDGCDAGTEVPFGAPGDAGATRAHLGMNQRPGLTDLLPGVRMAGMRETPVVPGDPFGAQQQATFQAADQLRFDDTGTVVSHAVNAQGWLVLNFGTHSTGYTRLSRDNSTLAETWLEAKFEAGVPTTVQERLFVKPRDGAGFGGVKATSRHWESGLFVGTNNPFYFDLYRDFTGERIAVTLDPPSESRAPLTWTFNGPNVVHTRFLPGSTIQRIRTWQPIANKGVHHWVMESEITRFSDGSETSLIAPRVNFYMDLGPAVRPPSAAQRSLRMSSPGVDASGRQQALR